MDGSLRFEIWKTLKCGGFQNADAIREVIQKAGMRINDYADGMLGRIPLSAGEADIKVALLSVADLGFKDGAKYREICKRAKELGLELCPAELGPQLRLQYENQPEGEWILIAMEPVASSSGPRLFTVALGNNDLWLSSRNVASDYDFWNNDNRFVFVLSRVK